MSTTIPAKADEYISFRATPIEEEELEEIKKEKVFCPTGPGGGVDATCTRGGASGKQWAENLSEGQQKALNGFFHRDFAWMRAVQKAQDPIEAPKAIAVYHRSFSKLVESGEVKPGQIYDGPDIKEFALGVPEEKRFTLLAKGQRVLAIDREGKFIVEPTEEQKQREVSIEKWQREELLRKHSNKTDVLTDLKSAFDSAPIYKGTVYRALAHENLNAELITLDWEVGKAIDFRADSSSTTDKDRATRYLDEARTGLIGDPLFDKQYGVMMKINTKTAADTREANPREKEVILRRNSTYRITKIDRSGEHIQVEMEEM